MPRPSRNTDRRLLEAGRKLFCRHGLAELTLRQIAQEAGVNLGMFHYHFRTKGQFARALLDELYEGFLQQLSADLDAHAAESDPLGRLRGLLEKMARLAMEHRELWAALVKEVLRGDPIVLAFVRENFPRHVGIIMEAMVACQRRGLIRRDLTPRQALMMCAATLNAPVVFGTALGDSVGGSFAAAVETEFLAPEFVDRRLDILFKGLSP